MAYTPPSGDNVNFDFEGSYTAPSWDSVDLSFVDTAIITIHNISSNKIFDDNISDGFTEITLKWSSDLSGNFRIESGGNGAGTGDLIKSGRTFSNFIRRDVITDSLLESTATFSGSGSYRINVYVENQGVWNGYE